MRTKRQPSQVLIPGVLTAEDIIRDHYRMLGRMGGSTITPKKSAASALNAAKATQARREKYLARISKR